MRTRDDLRPAQKKLIQKMFDYQCGIAVMGMGGGKTAGTLTAILDIYPDCEYFIILGPPKVAAKVWTDEVDRWKQMLGLGITPLIGSPKQRLAKLMNTDDRVFTCSIENSIWLMETLDQMNWPFDRTMLIIDEISKFKNPRSKRARKLMKFQPRFDSVWGLTGTPRPNGYEDLYNQIRLVAGAGVWGCKNFDHWRKKHFYPLDYQGYKWAVQPYAKPHLDKIAKRYLFEFPTVLDIPELWTGEAFDVWVELSNEQRDHYESMMDELVVELEEKHGEENVTDAMIVQAMSQGVASGKLAQIVQGCLYDDGSSVHEYLRNPKKEALIELTEELGGDNAVICYHYKQELKELKELFGKDTPHLGSGVSDTKAVKIMDDWNEGKINRLLVHPASVGHGSELQFGGHHLIWYHPTWSSELYDQMIKRLHRPGQTHPVRNWRIMARQTLDEIKDARVESKMEDEAAFRRLLKR